MTTTFKTLFPDIETLMLYTAGVETSNSIGDYAPSGALALKKVTGIIPAELVDKIAGSGENPKSDALKQAAANATMAQHLVFDSVRRRKSGTDVYKYEIESMRRSYTESYLAAMDTLLSLIADDEDFTASRFGTLLAQCRIKTCEEFDAIFPIDLSHLFFFRTLPLQRESISERLGTYYAKLPEQHLDTLNLALVKSTVAKALRRFDIMEVPATMRNLLDDCTASRNGKDEREAAKELASRLEADVDALLDSLDVILEETPDNDYMSMSAYNDPNDLIIMAP